MEDQGGQGRRGAVPHIPCPAVRIPEGLKEEPLVGVSEGTMPTGQGPQPGAC